VLYGTALWQVGDSTEQNGNFKMTLNISKEKILKRRINLMTELEEEEETQRIILKKMPMRQASIQGRQEN
jgi:hypothetical protein